LSEKRRRRWDRLIEDDPLAGLINLFDVWMVFSIALLLALVAFLKLPQTVTGGMAKAIAAAARPQVEPVSSRSQKLPHYRVSRDEMSGEGIRLGTAYRLKSGDVVYVPEDGQP
jgi:hypothetical protein